MNISGQKIKLLRQEKGWSQEQLGEISGLSNRTIQRIEKDGQCSPESKMALAAAFSVSPIELAEQYKEKIGDGNIQWGGIAGIVTCLLLILMTLVMAGGGSMLIDAPSLILVMILPLGLSVISNGLQLTWKAVCLIKWLFVEPLAKMKVHLLLPVLRKLIVYSYVAGVIGALIALLGGLNQLVQTSNFHFGSIQVSLIALIYGALLAELIFRPLCHKINRLLLEELSH